jgi:predicted CoA-substrate-specific enzyme activase
MYYLGIDIGSSSTKLIAVDRNRRIVGRSVVQLGTGTAGVERAAAQFYASAGLSKDDIAYTVATGYGRVQYVGADEEISEISCHAKGIHHVFPKARTIIDIGGQDIKIISVNDKGNINNFTMNDKCAAGTGRFIDVMSKVLDVNISEMGILDASSVSPVLISNTCTVFAESEVISKLSSGCTIPDVIAGIHESVARKVAGLALRNSVEPVIVLTGGVALNAGIIRALCSALKYEILIPEDPQVTGALGAAIFASASSEKVSDSTA